MERIEEFKTLYFDGGMSIRMAAKEMDVNARTLRYWIKKSGLKLRSKSEAAELCHAKGRRDLKRESNPNWKGGFSDRFVKYGISVERYNEMLEDQNHQCAICLNIFKDIPNIDHCHDTGEVRGLLCRACNTGIGFLKDDIESLSRAIEYLTRARWDNRK